MRLQDKVAIVTGSGSGIGRAMVQRFAEEGASVVIADINQAAIDTAVRELSEAGRTAMGYGVDVTSRSELREFMKAVAGKFGRIDILVNNAGVTRSRPFLEMGDEDWDFVLRVDLKGVFYCVQAVAEYMIPRRYGKILNISSAAGTGAKPGVGVGNFNYGAAKAGVIQLTKTLARELGPHGINVNCVAPGMVDGPRFREKVCANLAAKAGITLEEAMQRHATDYALRRVSTDQDVANACLFLASDASRQITGVDLPVDGGWAML